MAGGSTLVREQQADFSAGGERDIAPHLIDPRGLYGAENGMLDDDGSIYERGGSVARTNRNFSGALRQIWDGYLEPGRRTVVAGLSDWGVVDTDDATVLNLGGTGRTVPKPARLIEDLLFLPGGEIYGGSRKTANYSTGTVTTTNGSKIVTGAGGTLFSANVDVGMLFRISGERVYIVASVDSNTQLTLRDNYEGTTGAGKAYTLKQLETTSTPYKTSEIYGVVGERLLSVRTGQRNIIDFSARHAPHSVAVTDYHELDEGLSVYAIERVGQNAIVFTSAGIYVIQNMALNLTDAFGNTQHRVDLISRDVIAWGAAGIASWKNGLVVAAMDGVYLVDGTNQPTQISKGANSPLREHVLVGRVPGQAIVHRDHFVLPVLDAGGGWQDTLVWRLDRPLRSRNQTVWPWTQLKGAGAQAAAYVERHPEAGEIPRLLGADSFDATRLLTDDFSADTIGANLYTFDAGGGALSVAGGVLVPGSTAEKRFYRNDETFTGDVRHTLKLHTGAAVVGLSISIGKRLVGADEDVRVELTNAALRVVKREAGVDTVLATTAAAPAINTDYWLRCIVEGNIVTAQLWTAAPSALTSPAVTLSHTLAGGDVAKYGTGVSSRLRVRLVPASIAAERYDDFWAEYPRARIIDCGAWFKADHQGNAYDHDGTPPEFKMISRDWMAPGNRLGRTRQIILLYELFRDQAADEPRIYCDRGTGAKVGGPEWGTAIWGAFNWTSAEDAEFELLDEPGPAEPEGGNNSHTWFDNKRTRYTRVRLRCSDPVRKLVVRGLEIAIAPGGQRHGKVSD